MADSDHEAVRKSPGSNPYRTPESDTSRPVLSPERQAFYPATNSRMNGVEELTFEIGEAQVRVMISGRFFGPHYSVIIDGEEVIRDGQAGPERVLTVGSAGDTLKLQVFGHSLLLLPAYFLARRFPRAVFGVGIVFVLWMLAYRILLRATMPADWVELLVYFPIELLVRACLLAVFVRGWRSAGDVSRKISA